MSLNGLMRCDSCEALHEVKVRKPDSTFDFNFICRRCGTKISGSFNNGGWTLSNAKIGERKENEASYVHEPELT